ncbi:MotA/TolQ/ExbB proton channel family protein [Campylobacter porcelli]|uniref:MotA/TolQ/ExbB proton channel family protein n=1 Tax=Campylobacter porcelli TaxID=1660073 RepID=UPI000A334627|nr:MotA/TolQ/ExbB proton channel family protein [Campylobacter sp. P0078]
MLAYFYTGGPFMWPIFFLFVLSFGVILEKLCYFLIYELDATAKFKMKLATLINSNKDEEVKILCQKYKNTIAKTTIFVLESVNFKLDTKSQIDYIIEEAINDKIVNLEKHNWILRMCASVAPQLGLLGTITGMIRSFAGLSGGANTPEVAIGISEALYTTAAGLIVAIPCLIIHLMINKKIDYILNDLNRTIGLFSRRIA